MFGAGMSNVVYVLMWLREQLKLDLVLSFDNSSASSFRFGTCWTEAGLIDYSDVRKGAKVIKLLDGRILTDVPRKMDLSQYMPIVETSFYWYCKSWIKFLDEFDSNKKMIDKLMDDVGVREAFKMFRFGGTDYMWTKISPLMDERSQVRLVDGFRVRRPGRERKKKATR
jgi:hypothetical protein